MTAQLGQAYPDLGLLRLPRSLILGPLHSMQLDKIDQGRCMQHAGGHFCHRSASCATPQGEGSSTAVGLAKYQC
jgi:hypothetical protein